MPRDGEPARLRLRQAALDLYQERGFDQVTTAEIAARAGVTERTFYRHFADKREVLFGDEQVLLEILLTSIAEAPEALAPLPTLIRALHAAVPLLVRNRPIQEPRQRVIAATPALREREQAKAGVLIEALTAALHERGVAESTASLAAKTSMAVFGHAAREWYFHPELDLEDHVTSTFEDLCELTAPLAEDQAENQRERSSAKASR
jgi:AcrR family transcriptional regulator